jgi:hypothetical protein
MSGKGLDFEDFCNTVESVLCLPGNTALVERVFSFMNTVWSKEKSRIRVEILVVRQNCVMKCEKIYDK